MSTGAWMWSAAVDQSPWLWKNYNDMSALAHGCGLLDRSLDGSLIITDVGISALAVGRGLLQTINISVCGRITDVGVSALSHGCGQLVTFTVCTYHGINDKGTSTIITKSSVLSFGI
jgi:hypothetical protein